ncbi:hypothetical protein GCM10010433_45770 [Streptomyces pulveraceus]
MDEFGPLAPQPHPGRQWAERGGWYKDPDANTQLPGHNGLRNPVGGRWAGPSSCRCGTDASAGRRSPRHVPFTTGVARGLTGVCPQMRHA